MKLASRMCGINDPGTCWQIVLNASQSVVEQFPAGLFFQDELFWHRQQFGCGGHVASVNIAVQGDSAYTMAHFSDVVQRSARKPECRTLINKLFRGWHHMLLNAIGHFCLRKDIARFYVPTSVLAMDHTDKDRQVNPKLFKRLYDDDIHRMFAVTRMGDWWCVDVIKENAHKFIAPEARSEILAEDKIVCICHDIEQGLGHRDVDPGFAEDVEKAAPSYLENMLSIESDAGVSATYNVVGTLFQQVRGSIERGGHCLGFHSYDHRIERTQRRQLQMCEELDYGVKGYRPPQSLVTEDLNEFNLTYYNFDWLASGAKSLNTGTPVLTDGLSKIPIHFDDFPMYKDSTSYRQWEQAALAEISQRQFVAFSLHDCYAKFWLPDYASFLSKIKELGALMTLNEVAKHLALANAE